METYTAEAPSLSKLPADGSSLEGSRRISDVQDSDIHRKNSSGQGPPVGVFVPDDASTTTSARCAEGGGAYSPVSQHASAQAALQSFLLSMDMKSLSQSHGEEETSTEDGEGQNDVRRGESSQEDKAHASGPGVDHLNGVERGHEPAGETAISLVDPWLLYACDKVVGTTLPDTALQLLPDGTTVPGARLDRGAAVSMQKTNEHRVDDNSEASDAPSHRPKDPRTTAASNDIHDAYGEEVTQLGSSHLSAPAPLGRVLEDLTALIGSEPPRTRESSAQLGLTGRGDASRNLNAAETENKESKVAVGGVDSRCPSDSQKHLPDYKWTGGENQGGVQRCLFTSPSLSSEELCFLNSANLSASTASPRANFCSPLRSGSGISSEAANGSSSEISNVSGYESSGSDSPSLPKLCVTSKSSAPTSPSTACVSPVHTGDVKAAGLGIQCAGGFCEEGRSLEEDRGLLFREDGSKGIFLSAGSKTEEEPSPAGALAKASSSESLQQKKSDGVDYNALHRALPKVTGVRFQAQRNRFVAEWYEQGRTRMAYFPVKLHGFERARNLAIRCREEVLQLKNAKRNSNADCRAPSRRPSGYRTGDWDTPSWKRRRVAVSLKPEVACDHHYEGHGEIPRFSLCCADFPDSWSKPSRTSCGDDALGVQCTHGPGCGDDLQWSVEKSSEENVVNQGFHVRTLLEQQKERQRRGSFRTDKDGTRPEKTGKFIVQKLLRKAMGDKGVDTGRLRSGDLRYGTLGKETTESAAEETSLPTASGCLSARGLSSHTYLSNSGIDDQTTAEVLRCCAQACSAEPPYAGKSLGKAGEGPIRSEGRDAFCHSSYAPSLRTSWSDGNVSSRQKLLSLLLTGSSTSRPQHQQLTTMSAVGKVLSCLQRVLAAPSCCGDVAVSVPDHQDEETQGRDSALSGVVRSILSECEYSSDAAVRLLGNACPTCRCPAVRSDTVRPPQPGVGIPEDERLLLMKAAVSVILDDLLTKCVPGLVSGEGLRANSELATSELRHSVMTSVVLQAWRAVQEAKRMDQLQPLLTVCRQAIVKGQLPSEWSSEQQRTFLDNLVWTARNEEVASTAGHHDSPGGEFKRDDESERGEFLPCGFSARPTAVPVQQWRRRGPGSRLVLAEDRRVCRPEET